MNNYSKYLLSFIFMSINICAYGQILMTRDDYKKELWKSINPSNTKPMTIPGSQKLSKPETILDNKYAKSYINYKNNLDHLLEITKPKYNLSPNLTVYGGMTPINQLPPGSTQVVFMGGHFYFINTGGTNVLPSGMSFSGGGKKKLSAKSKSILINVYGLEIEE